MELQKLIKPDIRQYGARVQKAAYGRIVRPQRRKTTQTLDTSTAQAPRASERKKNRVHYIVIYDRDRNREKEPRNTYRAQAGDMRKVDPYKPVILPQVLRTQEHPQTAYNSLLWGSYSNQATKTPYTNIKAHTGRERGKL